MKKGVIICLIFLLMGSIFAEEAQTIVAQNNGIALLTENNKIEKVIHTTIPYGQIVVVMPGAGFAHRIQKNYLGLQLDTNFTVGLGTTMASVSGSSIYYFNEKRNEGWSQGGWNITCGIGGYLIDSHAVPFFPLSTGYQGDRFFFDTGFNIIGGRWGLMGDDWSESHPIFFFPWPYLKFGLCF